MKNKWQTKKLSEIATIVMGQSPPSSTYNSEGWGLPFFQGKAEFGVLNPSVVKWCTEPKKIAEKGDVLISVRAPVGPTNINPHKSGIGRGLAAIRPNDNMPSKLLMYLINNSVNKLIAKSIGTTFKAIRSNDLRDMELSVPPENLYLPLLAKIDEMFSKTELAEKSINEAKILINASRQSILKKAFKGELV
ncbi:restriction endonuclease subunit S [Candidatus Dojkabacteria bacterium]|uniref:Restriction endonuclease subunit S n=1 Tax=Candidatus Dojkabacteria bacterium TaxID=2099670 RepID=A0A955KZS7_9BACT|nr:restriction endonuclease subunit S [Candidatus Dojkabacteria bacterium]